MNDNILMMKTLYMKLMRQELFYLHTRMDYVSKICTQYNSYSFAENQKTRVFPIFRVKTYLKSKKCESQIICIYEITS